MTSLQDLEFENHHISQRIYLTMISNYTKQLQAHVVSSRALARSSPVGDGLQKTPEERLREGPSVSLPIPAPSLCADVLALDAMDEDGLQGGTEEVSIPILTGDQLV